ncbi:MAG: hypothetical protein NC929_04350 [Candidatus Omnitrophica bacterium]|nr:hypothetical protein [Candidatus Omnitrophota bacterium]
MKRMIKVRMKGTGEGDKCHGTESSDFSRMWDVLLMYIKFHTTLRI